MSHGSLRELLAADGVTEHLVVGSRVGVMAFHGGNLEVGTDQIADAVAERTGASCYTVRQPHGMRWHIPSVRFRPDESERLAAFVEHVDVVLTVHGFGRRRMFRSILLGGRDRSLARQVGDTLRRHVPGYEVIDDLDHIPRELRGVAPANPVNLPRRGGVQVELPPRIRGNGPFWNAWDGGFPTPHTEWLVTGLAAAVDALDQGASRSTTQPPSTAR